MNLDLTAFREVYFEESFEGLAVMEAGLLALAEATGTQTSPDSELINEVFRAAHTMKGGSGILNLSDLTELTHMLETMLDQLRDSQRGVTVELTALLLDSVDCLRSILEAERRQTPLDRARVSDMMDRLRAALGSGGQGPARSATDASVADRWLIRFRPHERYFRTGNDPLLVMKELRTRGELSLTVDASRIPPLGLIDPENCYLRWEARLTSDVTLAQVREVFDWVEDCCDLEIQAENGPLSPRQAAGPAKPVAEQIKSPGRTETTSLRVSTDKVDAIINLVGELVITQSMLHRFGEHFEMTMHGRLRDGLAQLARHTRELQETVLKIRMLPISFCFNRFPRLIHDLSGTLGKKITLKFSGEHTELDKTVLERISDPLMHLVRNSLDHGIESPERRRAAGKPEAGTVHLEASHEGGSVVIGISDDGAGLDTARILAKARQRGLVSHSEEPLSEERIHELIFAPGFSTAEQVTDLSGRGVGMDVVKRNVQELGGRIEIRSHRGQGTSFQIRLPLTLAILDGQLVSAGGQTFVVPLVSIVESLQIKPAQFNTLAGGGELYRLRDEYIPIVRLYQVFNFEPTIVKLEDGLLVVVEADGRKAGIFVDELLAQQQVVIKSLESNFRKVDGVSGATILGDGTVALILDVTGILTLAGEAQTRKDMREHSYQ
jgi:two-component system chemotaxis sensor kinase CheA